MSGLLRHIVNSACELLYSKQQNRWRSPHEAAAWICDMPLHIQNIFAFPSDKAAGPAGILSPAGEMRSLQGSSDLNWYTEWYLSAFSTPAVWNGATQIFFFFQREGWHEKESSRNGRHVCRLSRSCRITWHQRLEERPRPRSSMLYTQPASYLKGSIFLESWLGNDCLNADVFVEHASCFKCLAWKEKGTPSPHHLELHNSNPIMPSLLLSPFIGVASPWEKTVSCRATLTAQIHTLIFTDTGWHSCGVSACLVPFFGWHTSQCPEQQPGSNITTHSNTFFSVELFKSSLVIVMQTHTSGYNNSHRRWLVPVMFCTVKLLIRCVWLMLIDSRNVRGPVF